MKTKIVLVGAFMCLLSLNSMAQTEAFYKNIPLVGRLCDEIVKQFKNTNTNINKDLLKDMAGELYDNINMIIRSKKQLIGQLNSNSVQTPNYPAYVRRIQVKLETLNSTIEEYDELIRKCGLNAQEIRNSIQVDISEKNIALNNAIKAVQANSANKDAAIKGLQTGINKLEESKRELAKIM
jgi:type I site-specific restriction-modification system R (restriction) subunit